jgi:hypothetical protein
MPRSRTRSSSSALRELTFFTDRDLGKRFPDILRDAGISVRAHADLFPESSELDGMPDEEWLPVVGAKSWILLTHDQAMRYRSRERDAIMRHGVRAFMLMGRHKSSEHANNFIRCRHLIERTLRRQPGAFIAKLYHPTPRDLAKKQNPTGRIDVWLTESVWRKQQTDRQ